MQFTYAQDTLINKIISIRGGSIANLPCIDNYSFNNTYEYDGYNPKALYEYDAVVNSKVTFGLFFAGSFKKCLINYNNSNLFLFTELSYKKSYYSLNYHSNLMYYDSTRIYGNGMAKWKEHYLIPSLGLALLSQISKKVFIENNLSISKGLLIKSNEEIIFKGEEAKGNNYRETFEKTYKKNYSLRDYTIPINILDVSYNIGFGYKLYKRIMLISEIQIPIISLHKKEISKTFSEIGFYNEPLFARGNYNELFIGLKLNYLLK